MSTSIDIHSIYIVLTLAISLLLHDTSAGYRSRKLDSKWNPLEFPSTKLSASLYFVDHDAGWTLNRENEQDLYDTIYLCWYDAWGYTLQSILKNRNNPSTTTTSSTSSTTDSPETTETPSLRSATAEETRTSNLKSDRSSRRSSGTSSISSSSSSTSRRRRARRLRSESDSDSDGDGDSAEEYDSLLDGVIAFKHIEHSLFPIESQTWNGVNVTFGVLFNDLAIYHELKEISSDVGAAHHELMNGIFHECLYLTLNVHHSHLQILSVSEGMYSHQYRVQYKSNPDQDDSDEEGAADHMNGASFTELEMGTESTMNPSMSSTGAIIDGVDSSMNSMEYRVMITMDDECLDDESADSAENGGRRRRINGIIDEIIAFYSECICFPTNSSSEKYRMYHVSDHEMVYFLKIIDNDKKCLINIDMEYLESKCVEMIEYEPILTLDIAVDVATESTNIDSQSHTECLSVAADRWNLDFFDGQTDGTYSVLENQHEDHGIDQYILDTGILSSHEVFDHNVNQNLLYLHQLRVAGLTIDVSNSQTPSSVQESIPSHYHGTYVAGIAGGDRYGIARNLTIYDYEVCEGSSCSYSRVLAGIEAAKLNMISTGRRGVINLSFGGPVDPTNTVAKEKWDYIMKSVIDAGGIPVCSAGNSKLDGCNYVPGQSAYCISVGAFDKDGVLYSKTNYGECINIFAPGVKIKSAGTKSVSSYVTRSGTSAAAPHITGLISELLWLDPELTFDHILYILSHNQQYLESCPNEATGGTECPFISLPCTSFQSAIDEARLNVILPGTPTPTVSPSKHPTRVPTTPTVRTTSGDGDHGNIIIFPPTAEPSPSPIPIPSPTALPSGSPIRSPSTSPSTSPSVSPTQSPTVSPSWSPTISPHDSPTVDATLTTMQPTQPTNGPTPKGTSDPTEEPTGSPTAGPTQRPTIRPTRLLKVKGSSKNSSSRNEEEVLFPTVRPTNNGGITNDFTVNLNAIEDVDKDGGLTPDDEEGELYHNNDSFCISSNLLFLLFSAVLSLPYLI